MLLFLITRLNYCLTLVAADYYYFVQSLLTSLFQSVQEVAIHVAGLVCHNVHQTFRCLDGLPAFTLNRLEFFHCESVTLKHLSSDALCFKSLRHFRPYATQHVSVIWNRHHMEFEAQLAWKCPLFDNGPGAVLEKNIWAAMPPPTNAPKTPSGENRRAAESRGVEYG